MQFQCINWKQFRINFLTLVLLSSSWLFFPFGLFKKQARGKYEVHCFCEKNYCGKSNSTHSPKFEVPWFLEMWVPCGMPLRIEEHVKEQDGLYHWKVLFRQGTYSEVGTSLVFLVISWSLTNQYVTILYFFQVNLLVATSVGEEGLDIQTCCLVVRFDLPETVSSFIQSRGRARMTKSKYVFLLERSSSPTYTMMLYMTKSKYVFLLERSSSPTYTMMLY
jgi:hypothetical protein